MLIVSHVSKLIHLLLGLSAEATKLCIPLVHTIAHLLLRHVTLHIIHAHATHIILWHRIAHHRHKRFLSILSCSLIVISKSVKTSHTTTLRVASERRHPRASSHLNIIQSRILVISRVWIRLVHLIQILYVDSLLSGWSSSSTHIHCCHILVSVLLEIRETIVLLLRLSVAATENII